MSLTLAPIPVLFCISKYCLPQGRREILWGSPLPRILHFRPYHRRALRTRSQGNLLVVLLLPPTSPALPHPPFLKEISWALGQGMGKAVVLHPLFRLLLLPGLSVKKEAAVGVVLPQVSGPFPNGITYSGWWGYLCLDAPKRSA